MINIFIRTIWLLVCSIAATCFAADSALQKTIELPQAQASELLIKKVEPSYPPIAVKTRIQGIVKIQYTVNEKGDLTDIKVLSGHPFLVGSALSAVREWKYKPLVQNGHARPFRTEVDIPFSLGISEDQSKKEEEQSQAYFKEQDKCRGLLKDSKFKEAEVSCKRAAELAEQAPRERVAPYYAYQQAGHALFYQRKFPEALSWYRRELEVAENMLKDYNAELGYAYRDVAFATHGSGDLDHAKAYYERALQVLERARQHIDSEFLKNEYSRVIKGTLRPYAMLLRDIGHIEEAETIQRRADAIVVKEGLKDN